MKTEDIFNGKKEIIVEFFIGILFVVGVYYLFTIVKDSSAPVTTSTQGAGAGSSFNGLLQDLNKNKINLDDKTFQANKSLIKMEDFSITISPSDARGRDNPFTIYATPRPSN